MNETEYQNHSDDLFQIHKENCKDFTGLSLEQQSPIFLTPETSALMRI